MNDATGQNAAWTKAKALGIEPLIAAVSEAQKVTAPASKQQTHRRNARPLMRPGVFCCRPQSPMGKNIGDSRAGTISVSMKRLVLNVAGLFVAIVAILFALPSLYLMAAILWLIPAVSYFMGWLMLGGLTCERLLPLSATAGESIPLTYALGNASRLPKFYLLVRDTLPRGVAFSEGPPLVMTLWPGEAGETRGWLETPNRGIFSIGPAQVYSTDPLGLQTFTQKMPLVSELVVYPALVPLRASWLRGAAAQGWRGSASALTRGDGDDFYGVRQYQPGDELRRVHWRTTARTGTLAVTEYAQGVTLDVLVALDLSRDAYAGTGSGAGGALETAISLTATLLDDLLRFGHSVRLLTQSTRPGDSAPIFGLEGMPRFLESLARAQADAPLTLVETLETDRASGVPAVTLVVVSPDFENPRLASFLDEWDVRGGQHFGFALDAASFRSGPGGRAEHWDDPAVRRVRRGDDLQALLESNEHGWNG